MASPRRKKKVFMVLLRIIKRLLRTIRSMESYKGYETKIPINVMEQIIEAYNEMPHCLLDNKSSNEITLEDEQDYIDKHEQDNPYVLKEGDKVRVVLDKQLLLERRSRLTKEAFVIYSG